MNFDFQDEFEREEPQRSLPWLLTFTDVTALMLTSFVMIFAMSTIPSEKWDAIVSVLSTRSGDSATGEPVARAPRNIATVTDKPALPLTYLEKLLREHFADLPALQSAQITALDGAVAVSFPESMLFAPGRAQLPAPLDAALGQIAGALDRFGNAVDIVGHAAPAGGEAQSDVADDDAGAWRLSLARARSVAEALDRAGYTGPLRLVAQGATEFALAAPDAAADRRLALARRVDIVIHASAGRS